MKEKNKYICLTTIALVLGVSVWMPVESSEVKAASGTYGGITAECSSVSDMSNAVTYNSTTKELSIITSNPVTLSGTAMDKVYVYIGSDTAHDVDLTLNNLKIYNSSLPGIKIKDDYKGNVTLTLSGSNELQSLSDACIQKNGAYSSTLGKLKIKGSGSLDIFNVGTAAGIGGSSGCHTANIEITGGKLTLYAHTSGAAIGGGSKGNGEYITVSGGTVNAYVTSNNVENAKLGAAIGGGANGNGSNISVTGGTINARRIRDTDTDYNQHKIYILYSTTFQAGAGIGGGYAGNGNNITISGGVVNAIGDNDSAGIGSGSGDASKLDTNITISGGTVTASSLGGNYGVGIGSGTKHSDNKGTSVNVTISGGTVKATGAQKAPGIGAGQRANSNTYISGGNVLAIAGTSAYTGTEFVSDNIGLGCHQKYNNTKDGAYTSKLVYSTTDVTAVSLTKYSLSDEKSFNDGKIVLDFKNSDGTEYIHGMNGVTSTDGKLYLYMKNGVTVSEKKVDEKDEDESNKDDQEESTEVKGEEINTEQPPVEGDTVANDDEKYVVKETDIEKRTIEYVGPTDKNITKVTIPSSVVINGQTYKVTSIAKNAFKGCTKLKSVIVPNSVTNISSNAFKGCKKLNDVTIGANVKTIGTGAFSSCNKLTKVTIANNAKLTKIGDKAFYKCTSLRKITLPKNVTTIGKSAFEGCKKLKSIVIKSKKLKKVNSKAIKNINKKATIKCPSKKYVKKYKKLFKSKTGYKKSMKIK